MCVKMSVERHSHAHAHGCIHRSCHTSGLRFTSGCARNKTLLRNQHQRRRQQQDRRRACWWRKRRMRMRRRRTAGKISIPTASVPERRGRGVGGGSRSDVMRRCSGFLSMRRFLCCFLSVEFFLFPPSGVFPSLHPVACCCCCWCGGVNKSLEPRGPGVPVAVCVCSVCLFACLFVVFCARSIPCSVASGCAHTSELDALFQNSEAALSARWKERSPG